MATVYTPDGKQVEVPMGYFSNDCNEYLKTRGGLKGLLASYDTPGTSVESAIRAEHLMWGWPLFD